MAQCTIMKITGFAHVVDVLARRLSKIMPRLLILSDKSIGDPVMLTVTTFFNNFTRCVQVKTANSDF